VIGINLIHSAEVQIQWYGITQEPHSESSHEVANISSEYVAFALENLCLLFEHKVQIL
jgi:hypothetical protein